MKVYSEWEKLIDRGDNENPLLCETLERKKLIDGGHIENSLFGAKKPHGFVSEYHKTYSGCNICQSEDRKFEAAESARGESMQGHAANLH